MPGIATRFWGWDAPVLSKAVAELTRDWGSSQLDLSRVALVVPTGEAVRRLREALARAAEAKNGAVMAPHVWHPEAALLFGTERSTLATPTQEKLVWTSILTAIEMAKFPNLFPIPPAASREAWAAGVADTLGRLRSQTGACGLALADVAARMKGGIDADRWNELAAIEEIYLKKLLSVGLKDGQTVKRERATQPALPEEVERVLLVALPDPTPLLRQWIAAVAARMEVTIFVQAPQKLQAEFDDFGAPLLEAWRDLKPDRFAISGEQCRLVARPEDQARIGVYLLSDMAEKEMPVALGLADPSLAPHMESALMAEGVRAFDPAGKGAWRHALTRVLQNWRRLASSRTCRDLGTFLRLDDVLVVLASETGFSQAGLLRDWDRFQERRIPATLEAAVELSAVPLPDDDIERLAKLNRMLREILQRVESWGIDPAPAALRGLLEWLYGAREFATEDDGDRGYVFLFGEVMRLAEEAHAMAGVLGGKQDADRLLDVVLQELERAGLPDIRGEIDLVLHGWLELLWEPAAGLVVCGFNDENVPGRMAPDSFLPDHVREQLGLPCQAARRARDAYLLAAMAAQRRERGGLQLVMGHTNDEGDVLRPSRLLFACDDRELPRRIHRLFPKDVAAPARKQPAHVTAWKLAPPLVSPILKSVSATLLASYLRCPLRCYLERFVRMSPVESSPREMSAPDFGGLVHEVLAAFGREKSMRDSMAEGAMRDFLLAELERLALRRWGATPLLSTALQIESARQRLSRFATLQAQLRADGWHIAEVEFDISAADGPNFDGVPFTARVDRIDVHPEKKLVRVWDYKTRQKAKSPVDAHSRPARGEEVVGAEHEWRRFADAKGKPRWWTDLQLPLYAHAIQSRKPFSDSRVEAGYLHLPAELTQTKWEIWDGLNELIGSARRCAHEIVGRMKRGIFWPPEEEVRGDVFEEILLGDPLEAVLPPEQWREDVT
jgi:ATP-dependent helicase/nuclease subunit B